MEKRIICLDVGERRIGAAVSDPLGITAQGLETIPNKGDDNNLKAIRELAERYDTDRILCGLPLNMDGTEGFQAAFVRDFAQKLTEAGFQVRFQDERLTTAIALRTLIEADVSRAKRKKSVDRLAAVQILSTLLDAGGWERGRQ